MNTKHNLNKSDHFSALNGVYYAEYSLNVKPCIAVVSVYVMHCEYSFGVKQSYLTDFYLI